MSKEDNEDTEVVKIRITKSTKEKLMAVSKKECRTFTGQVRMVLDQWANKTK